eukprot:Skav204981  [mRNA]  locus=scaffold1180:355715:359716:- [translate_table: standard]
MRTQDKKQTDTFNTQNITEWQAIRHAQGYGRSFDDWLFRHTDLPYLEADFPSIQHLSDILDHVKADADRLAQNEYQHARKKFEKFLKDDWKKRGGQHTFAHMASSNSATFTAMLIPTTVTVQKSQWVHKGILQYRILAGRHPRKGDKLQISQHMFEVQSVGKDFCNLVAGGFSNDFFPAQQDVTAHVWVYKPSEMTHGFFRYWAAFWQRDPEQDADDNWQEAMQTLELLPRVEPFQSDIQTDDLMNAIKTTPTKSARGLCGWHIRELRLLPACIIDQLTEIMKFFLGTRWPEVLGWVRLALPPKTANPSQPQDGRPICIMSQLYRVFAKALAKYMLAHLSRLLPPQITGGIPGRSADQVWFAIQAQVEQCRFTQQQMYGYCLDIQKAFNAVPRRVAMAAMRRAGIPDQLVDGWFRLLQGIKRTVKIAGSFSQLHGCTTGIPEGDPISVPCMAIICWVFYTITADQQTSPWAYADNWEFLATDLTKFEGAFQRTKHMLDQWKMKLDLAKSWCWSVFPPNKDDAAILHNIFGTGAYNMQSTAKDLGATMRYRNVQNVQHTKKRFECAILRARRLLGLPSTLTERWRALIMSSISTALYAIELIPLGYDHFKLLRSALADVVCRNWKQRNEHLACLLTHQGIADPEVHAIKRCVRTCRKYMLAYPDLLPLLSRILIESAVDTKKIFGPIGCVKRWFYRLGWQITETGNVCTEDGIVFSLAYACPKHIDNLIDVAWERHVLVEIKHRKGMGDIPSINAAATSRFLAKLSDVDQQIMAKYLTGSFVFGDTAKHWGSGEGQCCLCLCEHDSQKHRVCDCPVFQDLRDAIAPTFQWMQTNCFFWPHLPVVQRPEEELKLRQFCALNPVTVHAPATCHRPDIFPRYYTDGSCVNPTVPECSVATWAVIHDCARPCDRANLLQEFLLAGRIPDSFRTCASGFVSDQQNNDRAELIAILHAVAQSYWLELFSDSEYAVNLTGKLLDQDPFTCLHNTTNSDIILELQRVLSDRTRDHVMLKHIRAHQDIATVQAQNVDAAFHALGNHVADRQAAAVWLHGCDSELRNCVSGIHGFYKDTQFHWQQMAGFFTAMTKRVSDMKYKPLSQGQEPLNPDAPGQPKFHKLIQWEVPRPNHSFSVVLDDSQAQPFPHPSYFVYAVATWLDKLVWPDTIAQSDVGITWLELLVDCVTSTATRIPSQEGKHNGYQLYVSDAGGLLSDSFNTQIVSFRSCVKLIGTMLNRDVFPPGRSVNLCKSLTVFPGGKPSTGLTGRPKLVNPEVTMNTIAKFFQAGAYAGSSTTFCSSFPFDRTQPSLRCPVASCDDPPAVKRICSFIRVQQKFKKLNS